MSEGSRSRGGGGSDARSVQARSPERSRDRGSISAVIARPPSLGIERARRGDSEAQAAFFQRHEQALFAYFAGPRHWHRSIVPDLVQETIARAIKSFSGFRGTDEQQAARWLFGIARNVHLQEVSRQVGIRLRNEVASELSKHLILPQDDWALLDVLDALDELPLPQLEVLRLMLEGRTIREIAQELDLPEGTVATRIHRARKRLRALLGLGVPGP